MNLRLRSWRKEYVNLHTFELLILTLFYRYLMEPECIIMVHHIVEMHYL